jgi:hypothetical protein
MASFFADYSKENDRTNQTLATNATTATTLPSDINVTESTDEENGLPESTFIDPDEQEILAAIRRDDEKARIEYEKVLAQEAQFKAQNAIAAKEQEHEQARLVKRKMYYKYGMIGGVAFIVLLIIIIAASVAGNKSSGGSNNKSEVADENKSTATNSVPMTVVTAPTTTTTPPPVSIPVRSPTPFPVRDPTPDPTPEPSAPPTPFTVACAFIGRSSSLSSCESVTSVTYAYGRSIPSEIGLLVALTSLDISSEYLIGAIPSEIGLLTRLENLDLGLNDLTGSIPSELGDLTRLTELRLNDNRLRGTVPFSLGRLDALTDLDLTDNPLLGGSIPSSLCFNSGILNFQIECDNILCSSDCCENDFGSDCPSS